MNLTRNNLKVNEIFASIQGEGFRVGCPTIFIRLSGCNLKCHFCDTKHEDGGIWNLKALGEKVRSLGRHIEWITWTGGEPTLQLEKPMVDYFRSLGYFQAIETNGSNPVPEGIDYITVSPKVGVDVLKRNFPNGPHEWRYPIRAGQGIPKPPVHACHQFLSPIFNKDGSVNPKNVQACLQLIEENPGWRLSVQVHKLLGVR